MPHPFAYRVVCLLVLTLAVAAAVSAAAQQPAGRQAAGPSPQEIQAAIDRGVPDDAAAVVAVVGQSRILAGDLLPRVDARLQEISASASQPPSERELQYVRAMIFRSLLNQSIQLKVLRESFLLSQIGTQTADKRRDAEHRLQTRANQMFQESELPRLKKKFNVQTVTEVDQQLRASGSSYELARQDFIDQMLAHLYRSEAIPQNPPVALIEIHNYYNDNREDYQVQAQARWEQLTADFARCGSRAAAEQLITEMGREAYFGGSMQSVAKQKSQEPFAARGGLHDWTTRGSLASTELDRQIFSLPLGVMSEVIEDETGLHIVRVLERKEAGLRSITDVQDDIREELKKRKIDEAIRKVTQEMGQRVPVWTLFPEDIAGALPLQTAADSSGAQVAKTAADSLQ